MRLRVLLLLIPLFVLTDAWTSAGENDPSWWSRVLGRGKKPASAKKETPTPAAKPAVMPAREKEVWLRRAEVCQKLREIALTSNDETLLRKADQLDQRAWETYLERISTVSSVAAGMRGEEMAAKKSSRRAEDEP